jgi:peptidoglycan/LPS O-acetylase OafA/YrhL
MKKFDYIDATRGWAIIGVLLIHASTFGNSDNHPAWLSTLVRNGSSGVQLFYIASALTLFLSMASRKANEKSPTINFFIRRVFRIAPLYALAVFFYLWLEGMGPRYFLGDAPGISFWNIVANLLMVHQLSPYWINSIVPGGWSIAVEMSFYLLVPLLFKIVTTPGRAIAFFVATLYFGQKINIYLSQNPLIEHKDLWGNYLFFYLPTQLPVFALGILLYFLVRAEPKQESGIVSVGVPALLLFTIYVGWNGLGWYLLPTCFVAAVYAMSRWRLVLLNNRITRFYGTLSYGLYICHWGVLTGMKKAGLTDFVSPTTPSMAALNYGLRMALLLVIGGLVSYALHRLIELPFQDMGKRLIGRREALRGT